MIKKAQQILIGDGRCQLTHGDRPVRKADYVCASGIFNVKLDCDSDAWEKHIYAVIDLMVDNALKGIAFNCLTAYSDADRMLDQLHYVSPSKMLDYCARKYSRWIDLSHDYGLFEFTIRMRFDRGLPHRIIPST